MVGDIMLPPLPNHLKSFVLFNYYLQQSWAISVAAGTWGSGEEGRCTGQAAGGDPTGTDYPQQPCRIHRENSRNASDEEFMITSWVQQVSSRSSISKPRVPPPLKVLFGKGVFSYWVSWELPQPTIWLNTTYCHPMLHLLEFHSYLCKA